MVLLLIAFSVIKVSFSKLCNFSIATKGLTIDKLIKHTKIFHGVDVDEAISIITDINALANFKSKNGFTDVPGECGKCNQQIIDNYSGARATVFKRHLNSCANHQQESAKATSAGVESSDDAIHIDSDLAESINSDDVPLAILNPRTQSTRAHPRAKWYSLTSAAA